MALDLVYPTMVHDMKMLVKTVCENVAKANRKEIIKTVTNMDGQCIWGLKIMDDDDDDDLHHQTGSTWYRAWM